MFPFSAIATKFVSAALSVIMAFGATAPAFAPSGGCADFKAHSLAATCEVSDADANATNDAHEIVTAILPVQNPADRSAPDVLESVWTDKYHYCTGAWSNSCADMWKVCRRDTHVVVGICWINYGSNKFYGLTTDGILLRYAGDRWLPVSSGNLFYVLTADGIGVVRMDDNGDVTICVPGIIQSGEYGDSEYAVILGRGCASVTKCWFYPDDANNSIADGIRLTWKQSTYPYQEASAIVWAGGVLRSLGSFVG